jgi:hypothetical protein
MLGGLGYVVVHLAVKRPYVAVGAAQQAYAQRDCAHVQVLLGYHLVGFLDFGLG